MTVTVMITRRRHLGEGPGLGSEVTVTPGMSLSGQASGSLSEPPRELRKVPARGPGLPGPRATKALPDQSLRHGANHRSGGRDESNLNLNREAKSRVTVFGAA